MYEDVTVFVYYKNIQTLPVEIFKIKNYTSPAIFFYIFLPWTGNHNKLMQPWTNLFYLLYE